MSGININTQIYKGSTLINFLAYRTSIQLCTGIGSLEIEVPLKSVNVAPYNEIVVYQNGQKSGVYYVVDISHDYTSGVTIIRCQDGSKKLTDYYVVNNTTYDYPTTTKSHIVRILNEVGISYQFDVQGEGSTLAPGAMFGQASAYDLINQLVQQSGWYFYFDGNGTMRIGDLPPNDSNIKILSETSGHLEISVQKNSETMRNKAIVWGNIDPETSKQVIAVAEKPTGYEMTDKDIRPIVISSPYIYYTSDASNIANKLLNEFANITETLTVTAAGFYPDYNVKDAVRVTGRYVDVTGVITSKNVEFSPSGVVTTFIINEKCPRLVAIYYYGGYVYVGTRQNGVWRKPIRWKHIWESFNSGINPEDYEITDLKVRNGIFACIANKKVYVRGRGSSSWTMFEAPIFVDEDTNEESDPNNVIPTSVAINPDTYQIEAIFVDCVKHISWVVSITSSGNLLSTSKIIDKDNASLRGVAISHYNSSRIISAIKPHNFKDVTFDYPTSDYSHYRYLYGIPAVYNNKIYYIQPYYDPLYKFFELYVSIYDLSVGVFEALDEPVERFYETRWVGTSTRCFVRREGSIAYFAWVIKTEPWINPPSIYYHEFYVDLSTLKTNFNFNKWQTSGGSANLSSDIASGIDLYYVVPHFNSRTVTINTGYNRDTLCMNISIKNLVNYSASVKNDLYISIPVGGNPNPPPYYRDEYKLVGYKDMPDYGVYFFRNGGIPEWGVPVKPIVLIVKYEGTSLSYSWDYIDDIVENHQFTVSIYLSLGSKVAFIKDALTNSWFLLNLSNMEWQNISDVLSGVSNVSVPQRYNVHQTEHFYYNADGVAHKDLAQFPYISRFLYIMNDDEYVGIEQYRPYNPNICWVVNHGSAHNVYNILGDDWDVDPSGNIASYCDGGVLFADTSAIFPADTNLIPEHASGGGYVVAKENQESGKYNIIGYTTAPVYLELPNEYMILTYPVPTTSYVFSGIFPSGIFNPIYSGVYGVLSDLRYSFTGEYGSLIPVVSGSIISSISGYPLDTRGYYEINPSGNLALNILTPITNLSEGSAMLSVYQDELYFLSAPSGLVASGYPVRVESFSTLNHPYLFTAVSGIDRVRFYQRDGNNLAAQSFIDRTNNLPDDWINVIRADELA